MANETELLARIEKLEATLEDEYTERMHLTFFTLQNTAFLASKLIQLGVPKDEMMQNLTLLGKNCKLESDFMIEWLESYLNKQ